jgi:type II secretory pathway component HofQ
MKIPILGWLFKNNSVREETRELLIFLTPRIMEQSAAAKDVRL